MMLLLSCCANEVLHPSTNTTRQRDGAQQSSTQIAVDQRQHVGKDAKLMPNSASFERRARFFSERSKDLFISETSNIFPGRSVLSLRRTI